MSTQKSNVIHTWFKTETKEEGMFDDHWFLWRHMIDTVPERDFTGYRVLDYGCNRGGFLQALYHSRPYRHAIGVDVAQGSLALARERNPNLPIDFMLPEELEKRPGSVDIAFSHEVIYLLLDLEAHARLITRTLKSTGVYYVVTGCHTGNPLWPYWQELIAKTTNLPSFNYSLDDYAQAFWKAGMRVEMQPFQLPGFITIKPDYNVFPTAADCLNYYRNVKTIMRITNAE